VKTLNNHVVKYLIDSGISAVGISPCINIPGLHAHGGDEYGGITTLMTSIKEALIAGLIPVVHGDAGLYGCLNELDKLSAGILGGDTLVEVISSHDLLDISSCIFLTDVDGVYSKDPKVYPTDAKLIRRIDIDASNGKVMTANINASGSLHAHDVTGGLEVSFKAQRFFTR
jgi:isopentenyl phosphate kinase